MKKLSKILILCMILILTLQKCLYCGENENIAFKTTLGTSFGGLLGYLGGALIIQQDEPLNKKEEIILGSSTIIGALYSANSISKNTVNGTNISYVRVRNGIYFGIGVGILASYIISNVDKKKTIGKFNPWSFYITILSIYGGAYIGASKGF